MNVSDSLSSGYNYMRAFFSRWLDWLILLILTVIPIVDWIVIGYYGKIIRDSKSSKAPPKIEGFGDMFIDGLKAFVVGLVYAIPIIIISVAALIASRNIIITMVVVGVITFIIEIFGVMAIVYMFKTRNLGKGFAFGEIWNAINKIGLPRYVTLYILYFVAWVIAIVIYRLFALIPIAGTIIGLIILLGLSVLIMTTFSRAIGLMYDDAMGTDGAAAPSNPPTPPPPPPGTIPPPPP